MVLESTMPDKLYFWSRSRDVRPGRGVNEVVQDDAAYDVLASIPHWRQALSNFSDSCVVEYQGLTYRTVEHVFQAAKTRLVDRDAAFSFALESGTDLARASGGVAQKHRKLRLLDAGALETWSREQAAVLKDAWEYKAKHCPLFRSILRGTRSAELWHVQSRRPAARWGDLELVRAML